VGKQARKRELGRPQHCYLNNIKKDIGEIGLDGEYCLRLETSAELLLTEMNLQVP
jgi:hypothetical protein